MSEVNPAHDAEGRRQVAQRVARASAGEFAVFLEQQVGGRAASEDILRDAFMGSRRGFLDGREQICSWFYRSLRDAVLDQPRRSAGAEGTFWAFRAELSQKLEPSLAMRDAIDRHVSAIAETLAADQADLLRSMDFGGQDVAEYARRAGAPSSHVLQRLVLARAELCRQVVSSFAGCSSHGLLNCTCGASLGGYGRARLGVAR